MKGILLAGGTGSRFRPASTATNKHLLAAYDKPLVYYPLSVLMLAGIQDILVITSEDYAPSFRRLLDGGSDLGLNIDVAVQQRAGGLPEAFIIGEEFIAGEAVTLILGDNVFFGAGLPALLRKASRQLRGATVFTHPVADPTASAVIELDAGGRVLTIEEKPVRPRSNHAVTGLYMYGSEVAELARSLAPSPRGELEITDLNLLYHSRGLLDVVHLGRGYAWLDAGTPEGLLEAAEFVRTIQERQGSQIGCLEEIAFTNGWIDKDQLLHRARKMEGSRYGSYIAELAHATP